MIIRDVEKLLDRQCIFSFTTESRVASFLVENSITSIVRVRPSKDGGFAVFNFETSSVDTDALQDWDDINGEIAYDEESVKIKLDLTGTPFISTFKALNEVPSVIIDCILFNGGVYYLYLRFHSADEARVGKVVREQLSKYPKFAIRYLGPNIGLLNTFSDLSEAVQLRYVEMRAEIPRNYLDILHDPVISALGISWTREMKYLSDGEIRAVFYDRGSVIRNSDQYVNIISREKGIYETNFTNPLIEHLVKETSDSSIVTLGMMQKLEGKIFTFATVVPDISLSSFFSVAFDICSRFKEWNVDIERVDVFDGMQE